MYKTVLGMSYYIHSGGPGALVDGLRPFFKKSTEGAVNPLPYERCGSGCATSAISHHSHLLVLSIAWQVVGWLQRLSHESILSIPSLSH